MALSKADQSLLVTLLTHPFSDQVKKLATQLAILQPDGKFATRTKSVATGQAADLTFKYVKQLRGDKKLNITFALLSIPVGKPNSRGYVDHELQFDMVRSGLVGEHQFTRATTNGVRIQTINLNWFVRYSLDDVDFDFEYYLNRFERELATEVQDCTKRLKTRKTVANIRISKQVNSENKLKEDLFNKHNLVGNAQREKLFTYLVKHCKHNIRLIEQMFDEMVHIIT
jgi:hypothetical protein